MSRPLTNTKTAPKVGFSLETDFASWEQFRKSAMEIICNAGTLKETSLYVNLSLDFNFKKASSQVIKFAEKVESLNIIFTHLSIDDKARELVDKLAAILMGKNSNVGNLWLIFEVEDRKSELDYPSIIAEVIKLFSKHCSEGTGLEYLTVVGKHVSKLCFPALEEIKKRCKLEGVFLPYVQNVPLDCEYNFFTPFEKQNHENGSNSNKKERTVLRRLLRRHSVHRLQAQIRKFQPEKIPPTLDLKL